MKNKLSNLTLVTKTTIMLASALCLILISINIFSATYTKTIISDKVHDQLEERVDQIKVTLATYDSLLKTTADSLFEAFSTQFDRIDLDESSFVDVNGVKTPVISDNGITLNNNFDYVDDYTRIKGSTATVFARMGDDFVRVTTSLKRPDGSRTLGTFLGKKSPAYKHIMNGEKYFGVAHLFGSDYMAVYNPIKRNGKIIGILYVGYNYTKSFQKLKQQLKSITLGDTGYLYILSTKAKSKGKLLLHPTMEGKNLLDVVPELTSVYDSKEGMTEYTYTDSNGKTSHKTAIFSDYDERKWKLVLGITEEEFLRESTKFSMILAAISVASILLIAIAIFFIIRKLVIKPVHNLQEGLEQFFKFLTKETQQTNLIKIVSHDEIGLMSELVNKNIQEIEDNLIVDQKLIEDTVSVANHVKDGHLQARISKNSNNPQLNELKDVVNSMLSNMEENINSVKHVLSDFTHFNYTSRVNESTIQADMKELYEDLNSMGEATTKMLQDNLRTGYNLKNNSEELSQITNQLSNSSNEQAASLEETAASLEELTSTMNNNEVNMSKMSNDANDLLNAILNGQKLATKTANSMDLINEQTNSIADAITVIDQIAFQTNILSLNAAVEAATAGEAGKGFAVVAGEVRNLAARSAEAAHEIKQLVESATTKTNEGKDIATEMITGYEHLNTNVHTTADMIADVISNFKEQVHGIEQINDAVSSLDKLTQENATIASNANHIAVQTDEISTLIVNETNAKEFDGKQNI